MNFKIVETSHEYPDVLLRRERDENGIEYVVIEAIGYFEQMEDMFVSEVIEFESSFSCELFIRDYSEKSADKWCQLNGVFYSAE